MPVTGEAACHCRGMSAVVSFLCLVIFAFDVQCLQFVLLQHPAVAWYGKNR